MTFCPEHTHIVEDLAMVKTQARNNAKQINGMNTKFWFVILLLIVNIVLKFVIQ